MDEDHENLDNDQQTDQELLKSRTEKKNDAEALQVVGVRLIGLTDPQLNQLDLPETLFDAVKLAQTIKSKNGKKRQLQFIGKLMRDELLDVEAMNVLFSRVDGVASAESKAFKAIEKWRDKIVDGDKDEINAFIEAFPKADIQQLRQLVRNSANKKNEKLAKKSKKSLFQFIKQLSE